MAAFAAWRPILKEMPAYFPMIYLKRFGLRLGTDCALTSWLGGRLKSKDAGRDFTPAGFQNEKNNFHGGSVGVPRRFQGRCG
jgi:hypothetical protein